MNTSFDAKPDTKFDAGLDGRSGTKFDALELTVFSQGVAMLAEEMGGLLERSSISPNIRERRDASCALFDAEGRMVAQAAHIPVHLGAMPESVAAVRAAGARAGEVFLLNDPAHGGSHLPDLTMVEVIAHPEAPEQIIGYAAVRAHHADVGGMSPGSMPFGATELFQEGLIVPPVRIEVQGVPQADVLRLVLANVRTPGEREGDLRAQRAACAAGTLGWQALHARMGADMLSAAVDALLDYTERRVRARLALLEGAHATAQDVLESDGVSEAPIPVVVAASVAHGTLHLDLTGTSGAVRGNVNAPPAVARAAAVFVLRVLCDDDVPVNDGVARALALVIPDDCVANAKRPSAVAAGNVELSQRLTDVCFAALAAAAESIGVHDLVIPAAGQGTMNNVTLGAPGWSFYETLGGGQGASRRGDGPDAVHVGMSNTRNTPIESLERAYPLRVVEYAVRRGSGGAGTHRGGDGVIRRYQAMVPCTATLLTERRTVAPPGAHGGAPGVTGRNLLNDTVLPAKTRVTMQAGDVLTIETPGGGGWG
ncbi:hydantoinase B/oxoprolinase family protein [Gemmatimonas aurantiaca]|uniref:hydantoinase B/oxoprolinase family protein n=1 Tax=Gemmatimonas aurantiaca TaxID=173480 RepID=UPI00301D523D